MLRPATLLTLLLLLGCQSADGPTAARAPAGSPAGVPTPRRPRTGSDDDSTPDGGVDAGYEEDSGVAPNRYACVDLAGDSVAALGSVLSLPRGLEVTHAFSGFSGNCTAPVVVVGFADGCDPEAGDVEVTISIDIAAYQSGLVAPGSNAVGTGTGAIGVRMRRPDAEGAERTFGSCAMASGSLTLNQLLLEDSTRVALTFDLEAEQCDAVEVSTELLQGALDLGLPSTFSAYCPTFGGP